MLSRLIEGRSQGAEHLVWFRDLYRVQITQNKLSKPPGSCSMCNTVPSCRLFADAPTATPHATTPCCHVLQA